MGELPWCAESAVVWRGKPITDGAIPAAATSFFVAPAALWRQHRCMWKSFQANFSIALTNKELCFDSLSPVLWSKLDVQWKKRAEKANKRWKRPYKTKTPKRRKKHQWLLLLPVHWNSRWRWERWEPKWIQHTDFSKQQNLTDVSGKMLEDLRTQ